MKVISDINALPGFASSVVTVGSFDGIHKGHSKLIERVVRISREKSIPGIVVTFEPHPRIVLEQNTTCRLLTTLEEKAYILEKYDIDYLVVLNFTKEFSETSPKDFIENIIIRKLHATDIVIGYDHHFGRGNEGNIDVIRQFKNITAHRIDEYSESDRTISSTLIRKSILSGEFGSTSSYTFHPYVIIGESNPDGIVQTDKYKLLPKSGEYKALLNGQPSDITIDGSKIYTGVRNSKITIEL